MKVLVVTQYYPPENAPTIPWVLARRLAALGHDVRVLTGYPNYPQGRIYDGYKQRWRGHERDGTVDVLRVPLFPDHSEKLVRRSLNYVSFALSAAGARGFSRGADVVYVYATQMTPALGPWLWRLTGGAPYVLHVQDLWPDSITGSSLVEPGAGARLVTGVLKPWLRSTYQHAAAVIGIAPTMVETLVERGVPVWRAALVYNWADEDPADGELVSQASLASDRTRVLYAGNVGDMQDLETAVRAAHLSRDAGVELQIVGDGVALPRVRAVVDQLGATNIAFEGRVPSEQVGAFYRSADFALVTLKDLPTFRGTIPSKFQAAIARGIPVITNVQGDLRQLVTETGVGFVADVENAESLSQAMRAAAAQDPSARAEMAHKARTAYADQFSLAAGVSAIEDILSVAARKSATKTERKQHASA